MNMTVEGFGIAADKSTQISEKLTEAAGRLAVKTQTNVRDVASAVEGALYGSNKALREYNITLSENDIKNWALRNGINANTASWNDQQIAYARSQVVIEKISEITKGLTTNHEKLSVVVKKLGEAFEDTAVKVYNAWAPTIAPMLDKFRAWLISDATQSAISKFSGQVAAYIGFAGKTFSNFIQLMQSDTGESFSVMTKTMIALVEAAGKLAIELAIKIGQGVWKAVRDNVFGGGPSEADVNALATKTYRSIGGSMKVVKGPYMESLGTESTSREVPANEDLYARLQESARAKLQADAAARASESLWGDLNAKVSAIGSGLQRELSGIGTKEFNSQQQKNLDELQSKLESINHAFGDLSEAEKAMQGWGAQQGWAQSAEALGKVADGAQEAGTQIADMALKMGDAKKDMQDLGDAWDKVWGEKINGVLHLNDTATERLTRSWSQAAGRISGSFEDAFASIGRAGTTLKDVIAGLAESIRESFARAIYQSTIGKGIDSLVGSLMGSIGSGFLGGAAAGGGTPVPYQISSTPPVAGMAPQFMDRGGLVQPLYAASGLFRPRGTDTVPAMLTPGELVVDKQMANGLQRYFGGTGPAAGNGESTAILREMLYQLKAGNRKDGNVVVIDRRESTADVLSRDARRRGPLTRR
jgi:hypothetical protein